MEMKSNRDCLNNIDKAIVENVGGISNLENIQKFLLERDQNEFIEDWVAPSTVLSHINSMIENYYQYPDEYKKMNMYS